MGALNQSGWLTGPVADESVWIRVEEDSAVGAARRAATTMAGRLGFPGGRVSNIAIAVTEIASNLVKHASDGIITVRVTYPQSASAMSPAVIECLAIDAGPGMADVVASGRDGHSTAGTLGIGLGAIRRIADGFDLHSTPGRGTVIRTQFQASPSEPTEAAECAGLTRPISGETECGDLFTATGTGEVLTGVLCDGLGHGAQAAAAAQEAVRVIHESPTEGPAVLLERVHQRIRHTRGGAISIAAIDMAARTVRFAGVGNVAGWIVTPDGRQAMAPVPGIAGYRARSIREFGYEFPPGGAVILHSDGLTGRWNLDGYPGLLSRHPLLIAATLLRDAAVHPDDAGILVMRPSR